MSPFRLAKDDQIARRNAMRKGRHIFGKGAMTSMKSEGRLKPLGENFEGKLPIIGGIK